MLLTRVLTVASLTISSPAIWALERPAASRRRTSTSRGLRSSSSGVSAGSGSERATKASTVRRVTAGGSRYRFCAAAKQGPSVEKALYSCQVTYNLANGTITAAGAARIGAGGPITVAVTGGTGAYAGARGTLTSKADTDTLTLQ